MMVLESNNDDNHKVLYNLLEREKQERFASVTLISDTLSKLNIRIEILPHKCQQILHRSAELKTDTNISELDPASISLYQCKEQSLKLEEEYEILKLKQKNEELQAKVDRNNKFLENLRRELKGSVDSLREQNPNPDNIHECMRQLKQKVASYEESCEKGKAYFTKLSVPEGVMPKSLEALITQLATLKAEAADLKQRADDITLARDARKTFLKLRR
ncbi:hypothetical protein K1T71_013458 [Dendrolimus kikuchii]|uniref:Uncharacterized protein n=1 Tax=Dendrolimus kikuchii TaxID=765133 RepID=A0ACC1CGH9_9NEOP|nr:hypothetical protein K1T71_013458 [Dendrolimus kikuchii]